MDSPSQRDFRFGDVHVDVAGFRILRNNQEVAVEPKAFQLLCYLAARPMQLVSKDELMSAVWPEAIVTDNALTRVVAQLRKALGDDARHSRIIETVPTQGYRFVAEVGAAEPGEVRGGWSRRGLIGGGVVAAGAAVMAAVLRLPGRVEEPLATASQLTANDGLDAFPSFSPDGSLLAYCSDRGGSVEVYVRSAEPGGREIRITNDGGQNVQVAWSPDGSLLAYHSMARGGISVVPATGGMPRRIVENGASPAWSPDGRQIAYRSGRMISLGLTDLAPGRSTEIFVAPVTGGTPRQVTRLDRLPGSHDSPAWSPDGRRLVFVNYVSMYGSELWTVDLASGELAPVDTAAGNERANMVFPGYLADGSLCAAAYSSGAGFSVQRQRGGRWREVVRTGMAMLRSVAVSADGQRLAYSAALSTSNLYLLPMSRETGLPTGTPVPFTVGTNYRTNLPAWSPDGARVAYSIRRYGVLADVFVRDANGGEPLQVTTQPTPEHMPNWAPDGGSLIYSTRRGGRIELWRTSLVDGAESRVNFQGSVDGLVRMSPDGRMALFHNKNRDRRLLWLAPIDGGPRRRLSPEDASVGYGCFSGDGQWVAAEQQTDSGTDLVVIPAAGGPLRRLAPVGVEHWNYSFSPGGDWVAAAVLRDGVWNLWAMPAREGGEARQLTRFDAARRFVRYPAWSPQGTGIVYEEAAIRGNLFVASLG